MTDENDAAFEARAAEIDAKTPKLVMDMIKLTDTKGTVRFDPQPDITAHQVALLLNLTVRLLTNRDLGVPDWRGYLEEHKLARHFKAV